MSYMVRMRFVENRPDETWTYDDLAQAKASFNNFSHRGTRRLDFASLTLTDSDGTVVHRIAVSR